MSDYLEKAVEAAARQRWDEVKPPQTWDQLPDGLKDRMSREEREPLKAAEPFIAEHHRADERTNGTPTAGNMNPIDRAFYDLTVKERNHAWEESARHKRERDKARTDAQRSTK